MYVNTEVEGTVWKLVIRVDGCLRTCNRVVSGSFLDLNLRHVS